MKPTPPDLTPTEWQIMMAVWRSGRASTAQLTDATQHIDPPPMQSTVRILLNRMTGKGFVKVVELGRGPGANNYYEAAITLEEAVRAQAEKFFIVQLQKNPQALKVTRAVLDKLLAKHEEAR